MTHQGGNLHDKFNAKASKHHSMKTKKLEIMLTIKRKKLLQWIKCFMDDQIRFFIYPK
jgi:hypothetical protein